MLDSIWKALKGKKTYLVAAALGLATFAMTMGWIDQATYNHLRDLLLASGIAALRAGMIP